MALIVFLRGVNVGGHRTFRPSVLARALSKFDVVNVGAAGTFVVRKPGSRARFRAALLSKLPFDAEVMFCDGRDLLQLETANPFRNEPSRPDLVRFVSILSRSPRSAPSTPTRFPSSGKWLLRILAREGRFVFGLYRRHMKVIGYLGTLDRLFGVPVTTRNWNTIAAIARVLDRGAPVPKGHPARPVVPAAKASKSRKASAEEPALLAGGNPQISKGDGDAPVQSFIAAMPGWKREVGRRLDALVVRTVPDVRKAVRWNSPLYGIEGQGWFLSFHVFTHFVKVTFFRGASLRPLPPGESKSKETRYLDIREDDELDAKQLATWIEQAASIPGWDGGSPRLYGGRQ